MTRSVEGRTCSSVRERSMARHDPLFNVNWTMDPGNSLFNEQWKPDTETRLYKRVGKTGYKLQVSGTYKGKPYEWGYTANYDGKDYPVYGRDDVDAIEAYRINSRITVGFFKKNGMPGGPYKRKLSADGKTLEVETVGRRPDGTFYLDVIQYNKS
jgi:hypothetical protein